MRFLIFLLFLTSFLPCAQAQQTLLDFHEESMASALAKVDELFPDVQIHFVYNELEAFKVTAQVHRKHALEAVKEIVGYYPLKITQYNNHIFVEYAQRQKHEVSGRLVDERHEAVPYATVSLYNAKDSTFLAAGVSNENGSFVIPVEVNDLYLRATSLGFFPQENRYKAGNIGEVVMQPQTYELGEVSILEKTQPVMVREGNLYTLQVNGTTLEQVGTAYDVLEFVPGFLGLDRLLNTRIYIDGVAVESLSDLTLLDAAQILKVCYNSAGQASESSRSMGVVHIYTLSSQQKGWILRAYAKSSQGKYAKTSEQVNLDGHFGKLDIMTMANFFDQTYGKEIRDNNISQKYYYVQRGTELSLGMNYELARNQSLGAQYKLLQNLKTVKTYAPMLWRIYENSFLNEFLRMDDSQISLDYQPAHTANLYYQGQLSPALKLRADGDFYTDGQLLSQDLKLIESNSQHMENAIRNTLYAARMDMEWKNMTLGLSYSDTQRKNSYKHNTDQRESSLRQEQLFGAYTTWSREKGHWKTLAGLRYEQSRVKAKVKQQYNWFFPHAQVSYRNREKELTLSYSTHSQRPSYSQLNEYSFYNLSLLYLNGNPNLKASYLQTLSLNWKQKALFLSASYQHVKDYIKQYVENSSNGFAMNYINLDKVNLYQLQATYSPRVGKWSPQWNITLAGQDLKDYAKPVLSLEWTNQLQLSPSLLFTAQAYFQTAGHSNATYYRERGFLDMSLTKNLRHWNIQLQVEDVLRTSRICARYSGMAGYHRWTYDDNQRVTLSVSYKLYPDAAATRYKGKQAAASEKERFLQ